MNAKKAWSRISALVLSLCMVISCLPTAALAADSSYSEITKQNAEQVREYAEAMQLENTMEDYSKGGFTWDTEEKKDSWRYFNGLMLDAFLMMRDTAYAKAFYDSNISADGTIKNYHIGELDSVEVARGLFDLLKSDSLTVEERTKYQNAIQYVYSQLAAQTTYLDCGDNFLHKQDTSSGRPTGGWTEYNIGLDGLYMALPFLVEYADALKDGRLDPVEEEVPADWDLTNPEDPAAGEVTTPEDPAAGEETDPETPAAGEETDPETPAAGEETDPETPAAGEETDPETPAAGEETDPETPATGEETAPETPAAGEEAAPEASGDNGTVTIEAQNIQYASANSAEAAAIYEAVYDRLAWVSENMYDETTGLFHHGWNVPAGQGNGHFWARGLGWYAMALVDITEMMPASYREDLTAQIQKLFAGVMKYQDSSTGMWYNVVTRDSTLSGNILETSGSAMFAYAMMKAYCCGYVDDMVGSAGLAAFNGTVSNKLVGGSVADIYLKSGVGNTDESYCHYEYMSNEAKGTGALIMAATWAEKAAKKLEASLEQPSAAVISDTATGVAVESATITAIAVTNVTSVGYVTSALSGLLQPSYAAYDIDPTGYVAGDTVTLRLPIPSGVAANEAVAYYIPIPTDGTAPEQISGTPAPDGKFLEITTDHFSTYAVGAPRTVAGMPTGAEKGYVLEGGGTTYELDTDGVDAGETYLIVNTDKNVALRNNNGNADQQSVTVSGNTVTEGVTNDCLWTFTKNGSDNWDIKNGDHYLVLKSNILNQDTQKMTVTSKGNGFYTIKRKDKYLNYNGSWGRAESEYSVRLYKQTPSAQTNGAAIWFDVTPKDFDLIQGDSDWLVSRVGYVDGAELDNNFVVTYTSSKTSVVTVSSSGEITAVNPGTATITAKLTSVEGKNVKIASIPISVTVAEKPAFDPDHPYDGLEKANPNNRPVYPAAGAVRLDKTASADHFTDTGVTRVELSVAGISEKRGVDVVLVVDVSNSMAWSLKNAAGDGTGDAAKLPSQGQSTKLDNAMKAAAEFSDILLGENTDGASDNNSLSFVTFAGYDKEHYNTGSGKNDEKNYVDSVMTVFSNVTDSTKAKTSFNGTSVTGTKNGTGATYQLKVTDENGEVLVEGGNRGNTNYDYAFYQAQQAVEALQAEYGDYDNSGRETYIVFMTDGAPSHYNQKNCNGGAGRDYFPDSTRETYALGYKTSDWTKYITNNANVYATDLYKLVHGNFYAIGFDLANGGFNDYTADEATLTQVLANMAGTGTNIPVMTTSNADTLTAFYNKLANQIKYAGTYAKVTDTVDSEFTLQTTPFEVNGSKVNPTITVTIYELYTAESAGGNANLIGTRVPNSGKDLETVTVTGGDTIEGKYFTYTKTGDVETFVWNIGDIADKEYVLSYDAYIKEEAQTDGLHYTNEEATLEYIDVNNCYDRQLFPVPSLSWGSAVTQVEYYLADEDGNAVNWDGTPIPFANRIRIGGTAAVKVPWNRTVTVNGIECWASAGVNGYTMVDPTARYTVMTNAAGIGSLTPSGTGVQRVDQDGDLKSSTVAFGVMRGTELPTMPYSLTEKQAVIDFGKPMLIDVKTANNAPSGYTVTPVAFAAYSSGVNLSQQQVNTNSTTISGAYGTFSLLEDGRVKYTPNAMLNTVDRVFVVNEIAKGAEYYYMYQTLTVIPATVVYYETELASLAPTGSSWEPDGIAGTGCQDTGLVSVSAPQTYGYDSSYKADASAYSNGSAYQVTLAQGKTATTSFSFSGTGFDIISRTGPNQGMIQVEVKGTTTKKVIVLNKGVQELNQIPVVSVNGLTPGRYTVTITAYGAYTNTSYQDLNRGGEFVFDAVRIYEPMEAASASDQTVAKAAYVTHGEDDPQFNEVRAKLFENGNYGGDYNVSYVDSSNTASFAVYQEKGPNNEVYLAKNQSIAFTVNRGGLSSFDIGAKTVNGTPATMKVSIDGRSTKSDSVISGTALYYPQDASVVRSGSTVVITNTGEGLLSITDIKTTVSSLSASSVRLSAGPTTVAKAEDILVWNKIKTALGKEAAAE